MVFQNYTSAMALPTFGIDSLIYPEGSMMQIIPDYLFNYTDDLAQPKAFVINNKEEVYKKLVEEVVAKMEDVQRENERFVLRINTLKRTIRQRARDVGLLKKRLDQYNDSWRTAPIISPHPKRKIEQKRGPKPKPKVPSTENNFPKQKKISKPRAKKTAVANDNSNAKPNIGAFTIPTCLPPVMRFNGSNMFNCGLEESLHAGGELRLLDGRVLRVN